MSADNGIYILHTKDGYRVTHAQAIENIYWKGTKQTKSGKINPEELLDYFCHCKVFKIVEEALKEGGRQYNEVINDPFCPICEYGIQVIDCSNITFPKKRKKGK